MTKISMIAAVDKNLGLGRENKLLCHLPRDLQYFKKTTLNKPVIMGRKTYESIGRALPGRKNIVISNKARKDNKVFWVNSISDALTEAGEVEEVMVIGGGQIFLNLLDRADKLYITEIDHNFNADTFFPKIDLNEWDEAYSERFLKDENNDHDLTFKIYIRKTKKID